MTVLPWRCIPMCQLSVYRDASVQTRREDCVGQQDADRCLKHWISHVLAHDPNHYIPFFSGIIEDMMGIIVYLLSVMEVTVWNDNTHNLISDCDAFSAATIASHFEFENSAVQLWRWATVRFEVLKSALSLLFNYAVVKLCKGWCKNYMEGF